MFTNSNWFCNPRRKLIYATTKTRPDYASDIAFLSQVVTTKAEIKDFEEIDRLNAGVHNSQLEFTYAPLDLD